MTTKLILIALVSAAAFRAVVLDFVPHFDSEQTAAVAE